MSKFLYKILFAPFTLWLTNNMSKHHWKWVFYILILHHSWRTCLCLHYESNLVLLYKKSNLLKVRKSLNRFLLIPFLLWTITQSSWMQNIGSLRMSIMTIEMDLLFLPISINRMPYQDSIMPTGNFLCSSWVWDFTPYKNNFL